jgi:hypothetical protein
MRCFAGCGQSPGVVRQHPVPAIDADDSLGPLGSETASA